MRTNIKSLFFLLLVGAVLFTLAGCTAAPADLTTDETQAPVEEPTAVEGASPTEPGAAPTEAEVSPTEGAEATAELPDTGGNTVQVQLSEYTIDMPASVPAGPTVFEVTNAGTEEHSFEVEGQGIEAELEHHLQPGETLTLEVDLVEGTYEVYCPVSDHAEEGMRLDLTVTAP